MGAEQAVQITRRRDIAAGADARDLATAYEVSHLSADAAVVAGAIDAVIEPRDTRTRLVGALWRRLAHDERWASGS